MNDDNTRHKTTQSPKLDGELRELSEQLDALNKTIVQIGLDAFRAIERDDAALAQRLRDVFEAEPLIAAWLTERVVLFPDSPLQCLARGEREKIMSVLGSIIYGNCA